MAVDALAPPLTGIGRYTWELANRIRAIPGVEQARFYRSRRWIDDPSGLLSSEPQKKRRRLKLPLWARDLYWRIACRGQVFHAPNYFLPPFVEKGVVTVHDLSVLKFPETHPAKRVMEFEKSFQRTLNAAAHLITDSETIRQEVIEYFSWPADRITAVHLGVASWFFPRAHEHLASSLSRYNLGQRGYSLCVSTIEPRKRIDSLLESYARLPEDLLRANPLVLVGGEGWHSERLHELIDKGQKAGWLRYLGFVPEQDLPALYAGAKLFIYPSIYEGFGLPVAEAMASGVPVITSNCSCLPEVAAGAAKLADPDDLDALVSSIREALSDAEWRQRAAADGLRVAARYTWDGCAKETVNVYAKCV